MKAFNNAPNILAYASDTDGRGTYRIIEPLRTLHGEGYARGFLSNVIYTDEQMININPDSLIVSEITRRENIENLRAHRKTNKDMFVVYDLNDLVFDVPKNNAHTAHIPSDIVARVRSGISNVDRVTTTTEYLKGRIIEKFNVKDVFVRPNTIPLRIVNAVNNAVVQARTLRTNDKIRIGWAGGIGHTSDMELIGKIMSAVSDDVTWVFFGLLPQGMEGRHDVEFHPPVNMNDYYNILCGLNLDIAIAPLEVNEFNKCKSNLKVLEYSMLNVPVIATNIEAYHDTPALLVDNNIEDWVSAINKTIKSVREGAISTNIDWLRENYVSDLPDKLEQLERSWIPNGVEPFVPDKEASSGDNIIMVTKLEDITFNDTIIIPHSIENIEGLKKFAESVKNKDEAYIPINNVNIYPAKGSFSKQTKQTAEIYDTLCGKHNDGKEDIINHLTGPAVYLPKKLLSLIGLPKDDYDSVDAGLIDWSLRSVNILQSNDHLRIKLDSYIASSTASNITQKDINRLQARFPNNSNQLFAYSGVEIDDALEKLELGTIGEHYTMPQIGNNYREWVETFDTIPQKKFTTLGEYYDTETGYYKNAYGDGPLTFAVITPVYNIAPDILEEAVKSVINQTYANWRLIIVDDCSSNEDTIAYLEYLRGWGLSGISVHRTSENGGIAVATNYGMDVLKDMIDNTILGSNQVWVSFLDHDDTLSPIAFEETYNKIREFPEAHIVYADEDKLDETGERTTPFFKPDFDYERLLSQNYMSHYSAFKWLDDMPELSKSLDGSQDYDFELQYLEKISTGSTIARDKVKHIPRILYHWRMSDNSRSSNIEAKPDATKNAIRAVANHIRRLGKQAFVSPNKLAPIYNNVQYGVPIEQPKVTIIIPTKDRVDLLNPCIGSVLKNTNYQNFRVVIVDNNSKEQATKNFLAIAAKEERVDVLSYPHPYSFAAINNWAADKYLDDTDFFLMLNNDTEVLEPAWLNIMVGMAMSEDVGFVGARLLYQNGTVQHAGVIRQGGACHHTGLGGNHNGYFSINVINHEACAVTAACALVSKKIWVELGGYNEEYPVYFNDVDIGLRAGKLGYRNIISTSSVLIHKESQSLGREMTKEKYSELMAMGEILVRDHPERDPYVNEVGLFLNVPATPPYWFKTDREKVVLIGGSEQDAKDLLVSGFTPIIVNSLMSMMSIQRPQLQFTKTWSLREIKDIEYFNRALRLMNVSKILVRTIGLADIVILPFLEDACVPVEYVPTSLESSCPRHFTSCDESLLKSGNCQTCVNTNGTPFGMVDVDGWRNMWARFMMKTYNDSGVAHDKLIEVMSYPG